METANSFFEGFMIGTVIFLFGSLTLTICAVVATHTPITFVAAASVAGFLSLPVFAASIFPDWFGPRM